VFDNSVDRNAACAYRALPVWKHGNENDGNGIHCCIRFQELQHDYTKNNGTLRAYTRCNIFNSTSKIETDAIGKGY